MVKGFSTKKLKGRDRLGQILKRLRLRKKISLSEAEEATKVRSSYLAAIESSNWLSLPQTVYARGFVMAYSKFLGFSIEQALKLFEAETYHLNNFNSALSYGQRVRERKAIVTPKILAYSALSVFILSLFSYVVFQLMSFAGNPNLEVISPQNNSVVEEDNISLSGITDSDTKVLINSENVPVSNDGKFLISLRLQRGVNIIKVEAINKVKKQTSAIYTIEYKPKTASVPVNPDYN